MNEEVDWLRILKICNQVLYKCATSQDEHEEWIQGAALQIWEKRERFDPSYGLTFYQWAAKMARWYPGNQIVKQQRRRKNLPSVSYSHSEIDYSDFHHNFADPTPTGDPYFARIVLDLISKSPHDYMKSFKLLLNGDSYKEIAQKRGISPRTAQKQVYEARKYLRKKLRHHLAEIVDSSSILSPSDNHNEV